MNRIDREKVKEHAVRFPKYSQAEQLFMDLAESTFRRCESADEKSLLNDTLEAAANFIEDVRSNLNPLAVKADDGSSDCRNGLVEEYGKYLSDYNRQQDQLGVVWRFPDASIALSQGKASGQYWRVDADALTDLIQQYGT